MREEFELPQEVVDLIPVHTPRELSQATLISLSTTMMKSRDEAVDFRKNSGIEEVWVSSDEQYNGIDDSNRHEFQDGKWIKPLVMNAPVTVAGSGQVSNRSNAFVRLTSRYVDAADAKVGEILIPIDGKAFTFTATPNPDLIKCKDDESQVVGQNGSPLFRNALPGESPPPPMATPIAPPADPNGLPPDPNALGMAGEPVAAAQPGPAKMPLLTKDLALEAIIRANGKAKLAETRIFDWLVECQYPREMRKVIHDTARLGVGVLKGPYPDTRRAMAFVGGKIVVNDTLVPSVGWRDPWNIFPDPACGENIQDGDFCWERDFASAKQVRKMKKLTSYNEEVLDMVLEEGPSKQQSQGRNPNNTEEKTRKPVEIWYFTGTVKREE